MLLSDNSIFYEFSDTARYMRAFYPYFLWYFRLWYFCRCSLNVCQQRQQEAGVERRGRGLFARHSVSLYHLIVLLKSPFHGRRREVGRSFYFSQLLFPRFGGGLYQLRRKGWSSLPSASCLPRQKPRSKCSIKRLRIFLDLALGKLLICDHYSGKMRSPFGVTITIYGNRFW